jgi:ABC transport system ATP-binding/permease protein
MSQTTLVSSPAPFIELNNQGQILRFRLERDCWQLGRDQSWTHAEIPLVGWEVLSRRQAVLQREGEDYRIYDGDRTEASRNGLFISHARIDREQGYLLQDGTQLVIGQNSHNQILLTYFNPSNINPNRLSKLKLNLQSVTKFPVELGREIDGSNYGGMQLDSPVVSRRHATISINQNGSHTIEDWSTNGTFVNDLRVERSRQLQTGDRIRIGPFILLYQPGMLELADRGNQIRLDAAHLVRQVTDKSGELRTILNDVSLSIEPGQLVALVGGSGAGKSTLMKTLLGIEPTTSGAVYLNGDNLHQHFNLYRSHIGYVPQDDIIHQDLTVAEVLMYACKLRLPPDTDLRQVLDRTLAQIKLTHVAQTFIRDLSGGQRKRVSIGVELLADPKLFFLDEPTSGLDPGLDQELMKLLRELADQGRTVILVTHATANLEVCDRVAFMARGGTLCYFGTSTAALAFFELPSNDFKYFADIYRKLDQGSTKQELQAIVAAWAAKFQQSMAYIPPSMAQLSAGSSPLATDQLKYSARERVKSSFWQQLWILSHRYWQLGLRDRTSLLLALLTGPIGILLIRLAIQGQDPLVQINPASALQAALTLKTLFIFSCVGIWVGISCSAQEIVKESAIYARERLVNLGLLPYFGSKILVRSSIAIVQTSLFVMAISIAFPAPSSQLLPWTLGLFITNFCTLISSICLGLLLSSFVTNQNEANNSLPLIMIPQIIFSGVLFDLDGISTQISWLMLSRWSVSAYGTLVDVNAMIPGSIIIPGQPPIPQPIQPNLIYAPTWEKLGLDWGALLLSAMIYLVIAMYLQKHKDVV